MDARARRLTLILVQWPMMALAGFAPTIAGFANTAFPADPAGSLAIILANGILFVCVAAETLGESYRIVQFRMLA